jgi:hypothetical protein
MPIFMYIDWLVCTRIARQAAAIVRENQKLGEDSQQAFGRG